MKRLEKKRPSDNDEVPHDKSSSRPVNNVLEFCVIHGQTSSTALVASSEKLKQKKKICCDCKIFSSDFFRLRIFRPSPPFFFVLIWKIVWFQCNVSLICWEWISVNANWMWKISEIKKKNFDSVKNIKLEIDKNFHFVIFTFFDRFSIFMRRKKKWVSIRFFCATIKRDFESDRGDQGQSKKV